MTNGNKPMFCAEAKLVWAYISTVINNSFSILVKRTPHHGGLLC